MYYDAAMALQPAASMKCGNVTRLP